MSRFAIPLLVCVAAAVVGVAVWLGADVQRDSAVETAKRDAAAERMLAAVLDAQAGARGYRLTAETPFLERGSQNRDAFTTAVAQLGPIAQQDPEVAAELDEVVAAERRWRASLDTYTQGAATQGYRQLVAQTRGTERTLDALRQELDDLRTELEHAGDDDERAAILTTIGVALLAFAVVGATGLLLLRRRTRAEQASSRAEQIFRDQQSEFAQALLSADSEGEAHLLLKRYLESSEARTVTVLEADPDHTSLEARTPLPEDSPLAAQLEAAAPRDCVAMRLATPYEETPGAEHLLRCEVCGESGANRLCAPLIVSGEVIGSVLTAQPDALDARDRRRIDASVTIAAPVLANLRTIAVAQSRASTDALTGLANRRALDDTIERMVAQSLRSGTPLAAIGIDLDHFKSINDELGHDAGDEVLEAVAVALRTGTRSSDFVGRWGGEEFCVLAPDTPAEGAVILAEGLRVAIARISLPGIDRTLSASFGVAICPEHATSAELLLRQADQALYAAKAGGRNQVQLAKLATPA